MASILIAGVGSIRPRKKRRGDIVLARPPISEVIANLNNLLGREPQTNLLIIGMTSRANARGLLFWLVSKIFPGVGQQLLDLRDVAMVRLDRIRQQVHNDTRSEEHTSELQSLMRNSYAAFCLHNTNDNKQ